MSADFDSLKSLLPQPTPGRFAMDVQLLRELPDGQVPARAKYGLIFHTV